MESTTLYNTVYEFIKVRQLNVALAMALTFVYLLYSYSEYLFGEKTPVECQHELHRSRSRSRSRSRHGQDMKRRRIYNNRCPDCKHCSEARVPDED